MKPVKVHPAHPHAAAGKQKLRRFSSLGSERIRNFGIKAQPVFVIDDVKARTGGNRKRISEGIITATYASPARHPSRPL
jgi:hypothetical protein